VGLAAPTRPDGLAPCALRDIRSGQAAGRFRDDVDPHVALSAVAGALIGLLTHILIAPAPAPAPVADATLVDAVAAGLLRMLGVAADEASVLVSRPLPALYEVP
jgi:hypothetical protein